MTEKTLFIGAAVAFLLSFLVAAAMFDNWQSKHETNLVSVNLSALDRAGAPSMGPRDAKVVVVEFFDPACATCSQFHPLLQQLVDEYPGKVRVVMRYAPLHRGSDQVVKMLEAAHLQGKFWAALERLFENQHRWVANHVSQPTSAKALLDTLNLDPSQFSADWNSANVARTVNQDIQDGQTLNVRATPEFFVNGRPMPSFGYEQLKQLVDEAIAASY